VLREAAAGAELWQLRAAATRLKTQLTKVIIMRTNSWLSALLLVAAANAWAQSYPTRPVRAIIPFATGGSGDIALRGLAPELAKQLGQPVPVENRPGANTAIGAEACARAAPDGHTICLLPIDSISLNPFLFTKLAYDPDKDLEPVAAVFSNVNGFIVNPALKVNTLGELIELAKAKPRTMNYGSPASFVRIFMEGFNATTGTDFQHIPYKGGGETATALLTGEIQVAFVSIANVTGLVKGGKLRILAIDANARSAITPDSQTLAEAGYKGFPFRAWFGIFVPKATPAAIVRKLHADVMQAAASPGFREQVLIARGLEPMPPMTQEQFAAFLKEDRVRSEKLVRQSGIKPE